MVTKQIAPRGNCQRIDSSVDHPNVLTINGPKPDTAPLTVYADAMRTKTSQSLMSSADSRSWDFLIEWQRTPVAERRRRSMATRRSVGVRKKAVAGELGSRKHQMPKRRVRVPARR